MVHNENTPAAFTWPVRVYWEDTDAGGVVFYANYLKFFERARTELLRSQGHEQDRLIADYGIVFAVRSARIDYLKPARFNDSLLATAKIAEMKKASILFEQEILRNGEVLCIGEFKIACIDSTTMSPKAIPKHLLSTFKEP